MNSKDEAKEKKKTKKTKIKVKRAYFTFPGSYGSQCGETVDKGRLIGEETGIKKQKKKVK